MAFARIASAHGVVVALDDSRGTSARSGLEAGHLWAYDSERRQWVRMARPDPLPNPPAWVDFAVMPGGVAGDVVLLAVDQQGGVWTRMRPTAGYGPSQPWGPWWRMSDRRDFLDERGEQVEDV